jgi:hypothetical protein
MKKCRFASALCEKTIPLKLERKQASGRKKPTA